MSQRRWVSTLVFLVSLGCDSTPENDRQVRAGAMAEPADRHTVDDIEQRSGGTAARVALPSDAMANGGDHGTPALAEPDDKVGGHSVGGRASNEPTVSTDVPKGGRPLSGGSRAAADHVGGQADGGTPATEVPGGKDIQPGGTTAQDVAPILGGHLGGHDRSDEPITAGHDRSGRSAEEQSNGGEVGGRDDVASAGVIAVGGLVAGGLADAQENPRGGASEPGGDTFGGPVAGDASAGTVTAGEHSAGSPESGGDDTGGLPQGGTDPVGGSDVPDPPPEACVDLVRATRTFLDLLEPDKRNLARAEFGALAHEMFEFLPPRMVPRSGVSMRVLDGPETDALAHVLRLAMSEVGYQQIESIRALESVLAQVESGQPVTDNRDPDNYFLQVFGEPQIDGDVPWGLRFEGHHLSIQMATLGCRLFSATPNFWGASPQTEVLSPITDAANDLLNALTNEQREAASMNFGLIALTQKMGHLPIQPSMGLLASDMNQNAQRRLRALLGAYLNTMASPIAADRFSAIDAAGFDTIGFAHRNGDFRVIGPSFLIEFVYHNGDRNHIHTAWRDFSGDYGADLITRHRALDHHDHENNDGNSGGLDGTSPDDACVDGCQDFTNTCCRGCLAPNGVCYGESMMWCDRFPQYRWCGPT